MFCDNCGKQFDHTLTNVCPHCGNVMYVKAYAHTAESNAENSYVDQPQQEYTQPVYNDFSQPQPIDTYAQPMQNDFAQNNYNAQPQYNQPFDAEPDISGKVLTMGILGLAFSCTPFLNFMGIIFSAIGLSKSKAYLNLHNGIHNGKSKTGKILSTIGLISAIIQTIWYLLYVMLLVYGCLSTDYSYYF